MKSFLTLAVVAVFCLIARSTMEQEAGDSIFPPIPNNPEISLNFTIFAKAAFLTVKPARGSLEAAKGTGLTLKPTPPRAALLARTRWKLN
ncbi:MAG: hypothetical protein LBG43_04705 [Treponema sp.]|jgi:hypothetical protein|nr:hypothetical protein [Treponema sp.]